MADADQSGHGHDNDHLITDPNPPPVPLLSSPGTAFVAFPSAKPVESPELSGNIGLNAALIATTPDVLQSVAIERSAFTDQPAVSMSQDAGAAVPSTIVNSEDARNRAQLQRMQQSTMSSSSIQNASISIASNLVIGSSSRPAPDFAMKPNPQGMLACRLPQPPDGRWLGCGQAAHAPIPCYAWQQMGLSHSNQIHDRVFAFASSQMTASSIPLNRMCAMWQPPGQNGTLTQGCGQLAHPESVCATWIAAGAPTMQEVKHRLLEWKSRFPHAGLSINEYGPNNRMIRKLPDKDRCVIPQPPDGAIRGCTAGVQHRGAVCISWQNQNVSKFEDIRPALLAWHQQNPNPSLQLCDFVQPPDGALRGCGAPGHKGRICAAWAEIDVLTRQEAIKQVRASRAQTKPRKTSTIRPDAEKLCNLPQPPDGRVIGCGEPFHRMAVCNSWLAFGVPTRDGVKAYVEKYREDTGTTANFTRVCRAVQPPDGRVKGCGLGSHRGLCPSWQALDITDRKSMMEYIQSNIENIAVSGVRTGKRRASYTGTSRITEFPDYANDSDISLKYFLEGDFDRSVQELTRRIQRHPDLASLYNNRGVAYAERGWLDLAVRDWFKAIELDPTCADAFANRGIVRASLDKPLLAGDDCKKALAFTSGHSHHLIQLTYAMTLYESGDFPKCISECEHILNEEPNLVQAKILMGLANGALQKYDLALNCFENASKSSFDTDQVLVLVELARKRLTETGSEPVINSQAETEASFLQNGNDDDDDDLLALSDNYNDMDDYQHEQDFIVQRDHDQLVTDSDEDTVTDESMDG